MLSTSSRQGCHIEAISEKPDTSCCPTFVSQGGGEFALRSPLNVTHLTLLSISCLFFSYISGKWGPVIFEWSAYPMAFECLKEVGCEDTEIFSNLMDECYHVCDGVKHIYNNDIFFTCKFETI